jgi:hypothetical protein
LRTFGTAKENGRLSNLLARKIAVAKLKMPEVRRFDRHADLAMGGYVDARCLARWNPLPLSKEVAHSSQGYAFDDDACGIDDRKPSTDVAERDADVGGSAFNPNRHRTRVDLYSLPLAEFDLNSGRHVLLSVLCDIRIRASAHVWQDRPRRWHLDQQWPMLSVELALHKVDLALRIITRLGKLPLHKLSIVLGIFARLVRAGTGRTNKRNCRRG